MALVIADLCYSISDFILYAGSSTKVVLRDGTMLWSMLIEFQIGMGFAASCFGDGNWAQPLRVMIPGTLVYCCIYAVVENSCSKEQLLSRHKYIWFVHMAIINSLTIGSYVGAFKAAWRAPCFARRRALLRGASYACNTLLVFWPNIVIDLFILLGYLPAIDNNLLDKKTTSIGDIAELIGFYLYSLNGAVNAGTYIYWVLMEARVRQHASSANDLQDIEADAQDRYFDLATPDAETFMATRGTAEAIAEFNALQRELGDNARSGVF
jgi:hypothetical protein